MTELKPCKTISLRVLLSRPCVALSGRGEKVSYDDIRNKEKYARMRLVMHGGGGAILLVHQVDRN